MMYLPVRVSAYVFLSNRLVKVAGTTDEPKRLSQILVKKVELSVFILLQKGENMGPKSSILSSVLVTSRGLSR